MRGWRAGQQVAAAGRRFHQVLAAKLAADGRPRDAAMTLFLCLLRRSGKPLQAFYLLGQAAALRGEPLDACRYRRPERRNAWVRGWHAGDSKRLQLEGFRQARQLARRADP